MNQPENLPRFAQDYSPEQRAAVVAWLATMPLAELRIRQNVNRVMLSHAIVSPHTVARDTQEALVERGAILTDAVTNVLMANMASAGLNVKQNSGPLA
jgi:hypothetical protein